jgi:hypothetical protein
MPTTMRNPDSGQVKFAQKWEVNSYKERGWVVDESATQDADGINKNPDSGDLEADMAKKEANADDAPAKSATKAEWEAYAAAHGIDTDGMTKDEIIEAVGS